MNNVQEKANFIRDAYKLKENIECTENNITYVNMHKYSPDGHAWNGRPYISSGSKGRY